MRYILTILLFGIALSDSQLIDRWHTYDEVVEQIEAWDTEFGSTPIDGPYAGLGIVYHHEIIGYSENEDWPIYAVKISSHAGESQDKPRILILGQCHAEEIYGIEISLELIHRLLHPMENLEMVQNLRAIVQETEIWVVPTHNPEGLRVVHGYQDQDEWIQDESYRKNKTDMNGNGFFDFEVGVGNDLDGVDLNRNFPLNWFMGDSLWQPDPIGCPSSNYHSHYDYYRGPAPVSENETNVIMEFTKEKQFLLSIAYHSSRSGCTAEKVIYPWKWEDIRESPDFPIAERLGQAMAAFIEKENAGGTYTPLNSKSRRGNTHDWTYAETGCIQFLIEAGSADLQTDDLDILEQTLDRNLRAVWYMLNRSFGYFGGEFASEGYQIKGLVSDASGTPVDAVVRILEHDGPMVTPRHTDSFGRFRRLLVPGTFNLEVKAWNYETHGHEFTPSSGVITNHDVVLEPLAQYSINFQLTLPQDYPSDAELTATFSSDGMTEEFLFMAGDNVLSLPQRTMRLTVRGEDLFPQDIDLTPTENSMIPITMKYAGLYFVENLFDLDDWNVLSGEWHINTDGDLDSQTDLLTPFNADYIIQRNIPLPNQNGEELALYLNMKYEIEWNLDTLEFKLSNSNGEGSLQFDGLAFEDYEQYFEAMNLNAASENTLEISLSTDDAIDYRGLELANWALLFEPDGECNYGDVNSDASIDVADILLIIDFIITENPLLGIQRCTGNANGDASVDIVDVVSIIYIVLNQG